MLMALIIPLSIGTYRTLIIMQIGAVWLSLLFRQLFHKIIDALISVAPSTNLAKRPTHLQIN